MLFNSLDIALLSVRCLLPVAVAQQVSVASLHRNIRRDVRDGCSKMEISEIFCLRLVNVSAANAVSAGLGILGLARHTAAVVSHGDAETLVVTTHRRGLPCDGRCWGDLSPNRP